MATEVYAFQATIPVGTAIATPFRQAMLLPVRKVDVLEVTIPPGPSGMMGFAITMRGINVLPLVAGTWIVTDDEKIRWPIDELPTSGDWQVSGYNLGDWPHTVFMRWLVEQPTNIPAGGLLSTTTMQALSSG